VDFRARRTTGILGRVNGSRSRSLALALALSLALHVLGWLVLSRTTLPALPPPPRGAQMVEIELQSAPKRPQSVPAMSSSARPERSGPPLDVARGERKSSLAPKSSLTAPKSSVAQPKPAVATGGPPVRSELSRGSLPAAAPLEQTSDAEPDFPVDAPKALVLEAPSRKFANPSPGERVGTGGETILGEPVAEAPAIREKRAQQAIDGWVEDDKASQRVEEGLVDSYFADIGKSIEGAFKDGEKHAKSSNGKGAMAAKSFLEGYASSASHYGSTGNPNAPAGDMQDMQQRYGLLPPSPGPDSSRGEMDPRGPSAAGMASLLNFADGSSGGGLVAVVELRQTKTGQVIELSLKHGSGDAQFDKWVLASVPEGLAKADPPPTEGAGIHEKGLHTLWAFQGHISYMRKVSDANAKDDWWYAPIGTVLGAMAGHFDIGSSDVEYFDPRHPHFVVNAKLLRVY
jgi:hypothetical protein